MINEYNKNNPHPRIGGGAKQINRKLVLTLSSLFLFIVILPNFVSAFLISDQGTNVREVATGNLTALANLTISIYDNATGGNLIFEQNFSDTIANGSWNVMIDPDLEYGINYYKDYQINGEDMDFDGNERLGFQSSVGKINNVSFINFSLINSCSEGSSIRLIYENGSVLCEADDSGSTETDLTNYALKNQSETFIGNITTTQTGFFGWLGSLASRITKLFVQDIDASGNVNVTGNVTASYFKGDGSLLTNLSAGTESDPIFIAENSTLWTAINSKLTSTDQKYNETTLILSVNTTSNIMSLDFYNKSEVDNLIDGVGNSSFNQSLTDTLYASITWNYNQTQPAIDYVDTQGFITNGIENNTAGWILNFTNIFSDDWSNVTITEAQISDLGNYLTEESDPLFVAENASLWVEAKNKYNETYATWAYNQTQPAIAYADNINTTLSSRINGISGGNESFNQSLTDTLYAGIEWDYNQTSPANAYTDSVNQSQSSWIENTFAKIINIFTKSEIQEQYYNKTDTYNKTEVDELVPDVSDFYTKSQVDTNLSYYLLLTDQRFNETSYIDNQLNDYYIKSEVYNKTETDDLIPNLSGYYNKSEIDNNFSNYYTKTQVDNNFTLYLLLTDQRFNETELINSLINSVNTTVNIQALGFYTSSEVDGLLENAGNSSFNQSLTDTLYASIIWNYNQTISANAYTDSVVSANNVSWMSTYNATYNTWAYNQTIPAQAYADAQDVIFNDSIKDYVDTQISGVNEGNSSWNQSLADTLYANIQWGYNMTTPFTDWLSTFAYDYNQTTPAINWVQSQNYLTSVADNSTRIAYQNITNLPTCGENEHLDFDGSILSCTADAIGSDSWAGNYTNYYNKTEVDTNLSYYLLLTDERYNETDYIDNLIADYYNKSYVYNTTEIDALIPNLNDYYTKAEVDNNFTLYLLLTDQRFNETALINNLISSVNETANIQALGFYNQTEIDGLVTNLNETDLVLNVNSTLWSYITTNEANWLSTYNATYNIWAYNQTIPAQAYADTQINAVNTTANIDSLGYLNKSGTNANQNINISPYNITTSDTGFFGWLGSLTSRITKLWVVDINATGNIETSENITATYVKLGGGGYMYDNGTTLILGRD